MITLDTFVEANEITKLVIIDICTRFCFRSLDELWDKIEERRDEVIVEPHRLRVLKLNTRSTELIITNDSIIVYEKTQTSEVLYISQYKDSVFLKDYYKYVPLTKKYNIEIYQRNGHSMEFMDSIPC